METLHYNYFQKSQKTIIDIIKAKRSWKFRAMTERERERERFQVCWREEVISSIRR